VVGRHSSIAARPIAYPYDLSRTLDWQRGVYTEWHLGHLSALDRDRAETVRSSRLPCVQRRNRDMHPATRVDVAGPRTVVARDRDGSVLLRRPESPLEQAQHAHGMAQQRGWRVHPPCHNPPENSGVATLSFEDGTWWCFRCEIAWVPDEASDHLTEAMGQPVESASRCPQHDGHLAPLAGGLWCPKGRHMA